jgi:hypothetical protein
MLLSRLLQRFWLVAIAITVCLSTIGLHGTPPDAIAQQRPDCDNFIDQQDSQVAFDADPTDPFGLDEQGEGNGEACEQPEREFGTPPLVNCDDLRDHPDIARALYDYSLSKYGTDRYNLVTCAEQGSTDADPVTGDRPNRRNQRDDPEVLDGPPLDAGDGRVIVSSDASGTGETLEDRLEARFAALEAQFAAFEARAANGFAMFPESGDEAAAGGQAASVVVSTSPKPIGANQRARGHDDRPIIRAQKVKADKSNRSKERTAKRDRTKDEHRNRR